MTRPVATKPVPRRRVTTTAPVDDAGDVVKLADGVWEVPDEDEGSRIEERAPKIPTPSVSEQVEGLRESARSAAEKVRSRIPRMAARKAGVKRSRTSVEGLISTVWSIAARVVAPVAYPVANVLMLQSPVAGKILEDTVKNTAADTILQPFARLTQGSQVGMALLGPPILVGIAVARPETQPVVEPLLREALRAWLIVAGPKMLEKAEEERKFAEEHGQTIDQMIRMIFTPPEGMADATAGQGDTP